MIITLSVRETPAYLRQKSVGNTTDSFVSLLDTQIDYTKFQYRLMGYDLKLRDEWASFLYGGSVLDATRV